MHVPGQVLRGDEEPRGGVPAVGVGDVHERDAGVVQDGAMDMPVGFGVQIGNGLLSDVLQADVVAGQFVHGTVFELAGDTDETGARYEVEPLPVRRHIRVSAQQGARGQAVLRR